MKQPVSIFPTIEEAYDEEFGTVDIQVYQVATEIWFSAEPLAVHLLRDSHLGVQLLNKAVANVSRMQRKFPTGIKNLKSYLYCSYKNLLLAELENENHRLDLLADWSRQQILHLAEDEETKINRKILVNEIRLRMDEWTRDVFDLLQIGYKYEELVPYFGTAANVIRSKFSKKTAKLARKLNIEIKLSGN
jgi:DNA-directed RNA polymerase specialized sigma24 family protein